MSEWGAIEKGGKAISAWEFRGRYLAYGEKYGEFFCPFCDVRLVAYLIYKDELPRSPHFAAKSGHLFGCDGNPIEVGQKEHKLPKSHYTPRSMLVPEALTHRPMPRIICQKLPEAEITPPRAIEISRRRQDAGSLGKPVPKTHLLQPIVEAFNITLSGIFSAAEEEKWDKVRCGNEIKKTLAALPLHLEDKTNYADAFRQPAFLSWKHPRIYHGHGSLERNQENKWIIQSKTDGKVNGQPRPFIVVIAAEIDGRSPKSHLALSDQIKNLAQEGKVFRWYAYGKPEVHSDMIIVTIKNPDYIYLKGNYRQ